jgi:hypothetical protein
MPEKYKSIIDLFHEPRKLSPSVAEIAKAASGISTGNKNKSPIASLKCPRIEFIINKRRIAFFPAGQKSVNAGSINITDGAKYPGNTWYGRISPRGDFFSGAACDEEIAAIVERFADDPVGFVEEFGRKSGVCAFCTTRLTDERSVGVGYGPTCAKRWGLWDRWKAWRGECKGQMTIEEFDGE